MTARIFGLVIMALLVGCGSATRRISTPVASTRSSDGALNPEARRLYLLGRLHFGQGRLAEAAVALAAARRFDPGSAWIPIAQGDVALAAGDMHQARALWFEATERDPSSGPAWMRLARSERAQGDLEFSVEAYQQAVAAGGGSASGRDAWRARSELVEVLSLMDRDSEAQKVVAAWPEPSSRTERRARAEARFTTQDLEGGFADFDAYLELQPEDIAALDLYLLLAHRLGHLGQARERLERARLALPADPSLARRRVGFYDEIGHGPALLEALDELAALEGPGQPGLDADRARILLALGRPEEALLVAEAVAAVAPQWPHLIVLRAQAFLDLGQVEAAAAALGDGPVPPGQLAVRVRLLRAVGRVDAAQAAVDAALAGAAASPSVVRVALRHMAAVGDDGAGRELAALLGEDGERKWIRSLAAEGRREDALSLLQARVAAAEPSVPAEDLRDLGALLVTTDSSAAIVALERSVALAPDDVRARYLLASALLEAGRIDQARSQATLVLDQEPTHSNALNLLAWSLVEAGEDLERALELSRLAVDRAPADGHLVDTLGWTLARLGRMKEAQSVLEEAAALEHDSDEIRAHLDAVVTGVLPPTTWSAE